MKYLPDYMDYHYNMKIVNFAIEDIQNTLENEQRVEELEILAHELEEKSKQLGWLVYKTVDYIRRLKYDRRSIRNSF